MASSTDSKGKRLFSSSRSAGNLYMKIYVTYRKTPIRIYVGGYSEKTRREMADIIAKHTGVVPKY